MKVIKIDDNSYIKEYDDGDKVWFKNNLKFNGNKEWFYNGKLHRLDGPAIEDVDGYKEWYYEGKEIKCSSQEEFERIIKLRIFW